MIKKINKPPICVTMGDPSGISGEIILKTWMDRNKEKLSPFFIIDDTKRLETVAKKFKIKVKMKSLRNLSDTDNLFQNYLPVLDINKAMKINLGKPDYLDSKYVLFSIEKAVQLALRKEVRAIVTNPVSKEMLIKYGFKFNGQTEFICHLVSKYFKQTFNEIMILSTSKPEDKSSNLITGLVTTHIPFKDISRDLTKNLIISKTKSFIETLKSFWKIKNPRIGICSLNPHTGESGLIGKEEKEIIIPAIKRLKKDNVNIFGPLSPDSCFSYHFRNKYDGIICMYHDQALIPVKTLDFFNSVNITGGLPIIRTSPDHGPAFNIAKKSEANYQSILSSIKLADKLSDEEV